MIFWPWKVNYSPSPSLRNDQNTKTICKKQRSWPKTPRSWAPRIFLHLYEDGRFVLLAYAVTHSQSINSFQNRRGASWMQRKFLLNHSILATERQASNQLLVFPRTQTQKCSEFFTLAAVVERSQQQWPSHLSVVLGESRNPGQRSGPQNNGTAVPKSSPIQDLLAVHKERHTNS